MASGCEKTLLKMFRYVLEILLKPTGPPRKLGNLCQSLENIFCGLFESLDRNPLSIDSAMASITRTIQPSGLDHPAHYAQMLGWSR